MLSSPISLSYSNQSSIRSPFMLSHMLNRKLRASTQNYHKIPHFFCFSHQIPPEFHYFRYWNNGVRTLFVLKSVFLVKETMLEGNISSLLSSTLSKVFEEKCLSKDNIQTDLYNGWFSLSINLWLGYIRYFNLEIKKNVLNSLSVPLGLIRGVVRSLEVRITTSSIFYSDPLRLVVCITSLPFPIGGRPVFRSWTHRWLSDWGFDPQLLCEIDVFSSRLECKAFGDIRRWSTTSAAESAAHQRGRWWWWGRVFEYACTQYRKQPGDYAKGSKQILSISRRFTFAMRIISLPPLSSLSEWLWTPSPSAYLFFFFLPTDALWSASRQQQDLQAVGNQECSCVLQQRAG